MKAIALFSGGLDSQLAAKLIAEQEIDVHALHFTSAFIPRHGSESESSVAREAADNLGFPLTVEDITSELTELVKNPPHGRGSGYNPCIDCRILQLRRARKLMKENNAKFVVTGEVLGQRPMSQRRGAISTIEREADLEGLVVRPLCAKSLEPSLPEEKGWVDRSRLKNFTGRQRTPQIQLAEELGVKDYPDPAGGCRLTEPGYSRRIRDLLEHDDLNEKNLDLLEVGRHFRLAPGTKLVVGRNHEENLRIEELALDSDCLFEARDYPGPTSLLRGGADEQLLEISASITARYGKGRNEPGIVVNLLGNETGELIVEPMDDERLTKWRI